MGRHIAMVALVLATSAEAQDAVAEAEPAPSDEIVVTGVRESTIDLPRLLKAQAAFRSGRAALAPTSTLRFQLRPAPGVALAGMTLVLRAGAQRIAVPIGADGGFVLPDLPAGKWELVHNRGRGRIAVRALVISAGMTEADRRLGDLRLQCRAGWELAKAGHSIVARSGFAMMGGCASRKFAFYFHAARPIAAAALVAGGETRALPVRPDRLAYRAPLGDKGLPNDAMVHVRHE